MLIPVLNILFGLVKYTEVSASPDFAFSVSYFTDLFQYYFQMYIKSYGKIYALGFVCALIVFFTLIANVFRYMAVKTLIRLRFKIMENLRKAIYKKFCDLSLAFFHNRKKGELINVVTNEVMEIEHSLINSLQILMRDPLVVIMYFIALFYLSKELTLFTIIFFPISGVLISLISKKLKKIGYFNQSLASSIFSFVEESLSGIKIIKSFTAEKFMQDRFHLLNRDFSQSGKQMFSKRELASPISEILGVIVVVGIVMYGGYLVINNESNLTGSMFIAYIVLYSQLIQPFKNLSSTSTQIQRGLVAAEKIFNLIDEPETVENSPNAIPVKSFDKIIEYRNVSFKYHETNVVNDINIKLEKGKRIALVGESGVGKSTLADLLLRYYDVTHGAITFDGMDIRDIDIYDLRSLIGIVSQDAMLFNDTIFNNIAFGHENASIADVEAAAKIANSHDFILKSQNGYQTIVGDRGTKLSGGQRQRITIARAVYKNPPILILDEATSSLDTESEQLVQDALNYLMQNRTSIVIAHRLSTIIDADAIFLMQKGRIIAHGTHELLYNENAYYKKLVDMQTF